MKNDSPRRHRRSIRLTGYNYSRAGAYFVTICTRERACLFGQVIDGTMRLNGTGRMVEREWERTATVRPDIEIDTFVVMPNHFHGIIVIRPGRGTLQRAPTTERFGKPTSNTIPTIIRLFKSTTTKQINEARRAPGVPVWQRNYYEHVIRNEQSLSRVRQYIADNPGQWETDRENPIHPGLSHTPLPPKDEPWRI